MGNAYPYSSPGGGDAEPWEVDWEDTKNTLEEGDHYVKNGESPVLYRYDQGQWIRVKKTYLSAWIPWSDQIATGDRIVLEGFPKVEDSVDMGAATYPVDINGEYTVHLSDPSANKIVIEGLITYDGLLQGGGYIYVTKDTTISCTFVVPRMDYVVSCGNRLWGCRYGEANNGEFVNEIYASALGDPGRWNLYADGSDADK